MEVIYKGEKIDTEIQKREQKLKKKLVKKTENETNYRNKLVIVEAKEQII